MPAQICKQYLRAPKKPEQTLALTESDMPDNPEVDDAPDGCAGPRATALSSAWPWPVLYMVDFLLETVTPKSSRIAVAKQIREGLKAMSVHFKDKKVLDHHRLGVPKSKDLSAKDGDGGTTRFWASAESETSAWKTTATSTGSRR